MVRWPPVFVGQQFGRPLSFGNALAEEAKALAKGSSLLLPFSLGDALAEEAKALTEGSSLLLAGTGGMLIEELLAAGSLVRSLASSVMAFACAAAACRRCSIACSARSQHSCSCCMQASATSRCSRHEVWGASRAKRRRRRSQRGGRRLPCLSDMSATSRLLVKEALAMCSLPLTFEGSALVKKTLSCVSGLLVGGLLLLACTNSVLIEELLAVGILFRGPSYKIGGGSRGEE